MIEGATAHNSLGRHRFRWVVRLTRQAAALELDVTGEELASEARARSAEKMSARDRWASFGLAGSFLAVAGILAATVTSERSPSAATVAVLVGAYAVASRVEFEVGAGSAVPTQLVLVPMLFLLPLGQVPLWLALGYVLGALVQRDGQKSVVERALIPLCGSWHAVGPVVVLELAGARPPRLDDWWIYGAALAAQFAFDLGSSALRDSLAHGVPVRVLARYLVWVFVVDTMLAPVGLAIAFTAQAHAAAAALGLPLVGLLAIFARERSARIDHALELSGAYRGTELLAETYHEILAEGTLENALDRIADTLSTLITIDGVSVVGFDGAADEPRSLLERGEQAAAEAAHVAMPMVSRGVHKGVLNVWRTAPSRPFDPDEVQLVQWFADAAALALDNARARAVLERQAQTDSLTGLLNHRAFQERLRAELEAVRRGAGTLALLLLDIDNFKRINDVHGHGVGDHVLSRIAGVLRGAARPEDHVCRIGGEEFVVILPAGKAEEATDLAERIAQELAVSELDPAGNVTVSIGIAEAPRDASGARELAVCADIAMLSAKARGKNQFVIYDPAASRLRSRSGRSRRDEDLRSISHLKMLQSLAGKLNRLNDVKLIGEAIVDELRTLIDYHACRVYVDEGALLVPVALRGEHEVYEDESVETLIVEFGEGVTGTAAARRESLLIPDADRCEFAVQIPGTDPIDESMVAVPLLYGARAIGVIVISKLGLSQFDDSDVRLLEVLAGHASVAIENARLLETMRRKADGLEEDFLSTVEALANALEARDEETSSHARAITDLALAVGEELELDPTRLKRLELGALMHDIGKIGIPTDILAKEGPLTPEEYRIVQRHPELGERILAPIARLADVREIVRHCHEHWDGSGYPDELLGTDIPLESRIILVVDAYHAMTTDRPYRLRLPEHEARTRLREGAGTQFDPQIVGTFLALLERLEPATALVA